MSTTAFSDAQIVQSWVDNAASWATAVREGRIESHRRVTDRVIVERVLANAPGCVLDVDCGEGWLARELLVVVIFMCCLTTISRTACLRLGSMRWCATSLCWSMMC
jgi:hypothetical protein